MTNECGCPYGNCDCSVKRPDEPAIGSRWQHKKTKRIAVVVGVWKTVVTFRYTEPVRKGRGYHLMRPRTNTTPQNLTRFLAAFELEGSQ